MKLTNNISLFSEIDEIRHKVQTLDKYDPVTSVIKERFKQEIASHLTSLSGDPSGFIENNRIEQPSQSNERELYKILGVHYAITQLFFDITKTKLDTQHVVLLYEMLFSEAEQIGKKDIEIIDELIKWYYQNQGDPQVHPLMLAAEFHHKFSTDKPFPDGNGRIGRLLMNIVLLRHDYLPILILPEERNIYYKTLHSADAGNLRPLAQFVAQKELETMTDFINSPEYLSIQAKYDLEAQLKQLHGSEKCIVLTEDSGTDNLLALVLEASGFMMGETNIISYEGCSKLASANLFSMFVKEKMPHVKIVVHRDHDYLTEEEVEDIAAQFERIDVHFFVTHGTDVESYFLNEKHVKECHRSLSAQDANLLVVQCIADTRLKSIDMLRKKEFGGASSRRHTHLNQAIENLVDANLFRFTHGKTAKKDLEHLINRKLEQKARLDTLSPYLADERLQKIARRIWGA